jgi:hypothetical protein
MDFIQGFKGAPGQVVIPSIFTIRFKPQYGVEDDTFRKLWDEAMYKTSKYLMSRTQSQARIHSAILQRQYGEALESLRRTAGPVNYPQQLTKLEQHKLTRLEWYTNRRLERQQRSLLPKEERVGKVAPSNDAAASTSARPRGRQNQQQKRKFTPRDNSTRGSRSPGIQGPAAKTGKFNTNKNFQQGGRNFDQNKSSYNQRQKRQDGGMQNFRGDRRQNQSSSAYGSGRQQERSNQSDNNPQGRFTNSEQDFLKNFAKMMASKK